MDLVPSQDVLKLKMKVLERRQSLGKGAYQADIVLDGKDILNLQLMRRRHMEE